MKPNQQIKLSNRTQEIVLYAFNNPSLKQADIASHFGVSVQRISQIMTSDRVLQAFPILAKRRVRSMVPKAVERLEALMTQNENFAVSEKVVSKILDQADVLTPQPTVVIHELRFKSVEELQTIVDGVKHIQQPVIDAELI